MLQFYFLLFQSVVILPNPVSINVWAGFKVVMVIRIGDVVGRHTTSSVIRRRREKI